MQRRITTTKTHFIHNVVHKIPDRSNNNDAFHRICWRIEEQQGGMCVENESDIQNLVDQLGTLSVVTLGPVVASTGLTEDEVVGTEELTEGTSTDGVHGTGLQVDEDGTGDILVTRGLWWALASK